ncbi:glycosyltransferase family 4 protein [Rossellomorea marisflavi]|uniref:glycosyltransferase family 4 protein n=1 Tax=Rossellomorea marisflavi TaxID=189381 RepID=UPI003D2F4ADD
MKNIGYLSGAPRVSTKDSSQTGGPRAHILGVINALQKNGYKVTRFIVGDRVPEMLEAKDSLKLISGNIFKTILSDIARILLGFINSIRAYNELKGKVDVVYERNSLLQSIGWLFKKNGTPWIMESNGIFFEEAKYERNSLVLTKLARKIELHGYRKSDYVVCISETLKNLIVEKSGINPQKVLVIPNGVDTEFFNPSIHKPIKIFDKGITIGFVGSVIEWQGLDILINSVAKLKSQGIMVKVCIVGDGPALQDLISLSKALDIESQVSFVGRVGFSQIPSYILGFDLGFSGQVNMKKSKMYHSPLKLYEYMSMGIPVLATSFDDAKSTIRNGYNGYLVNPGDEQSLITGLKNSIMNIDNLKLNSEKSRSEIVNNHSWESKMKKVIDVIDLAIPKGKSL